jgi:hypothetical protein
VIEERAVVGWVEEGEKDEMGFMSTVQRQKLQGALGLAIVATLGAFALGCSDSIDGAPTCDSGHLVVSGQSSGQDISIDVTAKGTASQNDAGGTLRVPIGSDPAAAFTLTWTTKIDGSDATDVSGSVSGIPGGPLCYGGDSQIEIGDQLTFHLAGLHACDASSVILGEVFGCVGVTVSTSDSGGSGGGSSN